MTLKNLYISSVLITFSENGNLEQTPVFTMESHILAHQFHQLFMKIMIDFSVVFHLGVGHYFYQLLAHFWT